MIGAAVGSKIELRDSAGKLRGWWTCTKAPEPGRGDPHGKWEWRDA